MSHPLELRAYERAAHRQMNAEARKALAALQRVQSSAWLWADTVRQCVEQQTGMGIEDERVLDVPAYGTVLDRCAEISRLVEAFEKSLERLRSMPAVDVRRQTEAEREAER